MSNLKPSDLFVVGRGDTSYNIAFSDVKTSVGGDILPDLGNNNKQPGTIDDRYVNLSGDAMSGRLDISVTNGAALRISGGFAMKGEGQPIDGDNLFYSGGNSVSYTGDVIELTHITTKKYVDDKVDIVADDLSSLEGTVDDLAADVADNAQAIIDETDRATKAESDLADLIEDEVLRAQGAEGDLDDKIDALELGNLADVVVSGVTDNQVLYYDEATAEWKAKQIVLSSNLDFSGSIDLTVTAPAAQDGELYVNNTTTGSVDASFGAAVSAAIPNGVTGGEIVAYNGTDWAYVGAIGGGLTYQSFNVNNIAATTGSQGELSYNTSNGMFTFTKVDLLSRVPMNLSDLAPLPA